MSVDSFPLNTAITHIYSASIKYILYGLNLKIIGDTCMGLEMVHKPSPSPGLEPKIDHTRHNKGISFKPHPPNLPTYYYLPRAATAKNRGPNLGGGSH